MGGVVPETIARSAAPGLVRDRLSGRPGTRWVGIDGFGAAGKSTLAHEIAAELPGSVVIAVDQARCAGMLAA